MADSDCGGCNSGECVYPTSDSSNTNWLPASSTLGDQPSCDCKGTGYVGQHCEMKCSKDCLHGGKCVPSKEDGGEDNCSCTKAVVDGNPYAGLVCEYGATKSCMVLGSESKHSFCTNGGDCGGFVTDNQLHLDCSCDEGFEGAHCEYLAGTDPTTTTTTPATTTAAAAKGQATNTTPASTLSPTVVYVFIGALIASICLIIASFYIRAKRRANEQRQELELREATEELAMVDDDESDIHGEMGII
mmetsp:Transcript_4720/g.6875  ORF Transcript_4720/g.6875 Transcript_4720/m.6875 type:complete len:245 (+) Transcript_4720:70-804(+)